MNKKQNTLIGITAITAVIVTLALISCPNDNGNNGKDPDPIDREFAFTVDGKTVTVKDERTGNPPQDLQALGIVSTLEGAMNQVKAEAAVSASSTDRFNAVLDRGLSILIRNIEGDSEIIDNRTLVIGFDHVSAPESDILVTLWQAIASINGGMGTMAD